LALVLAGSYMASTGVTPSEYLEFYEDRFQDLNRESGTQDSYLNGTIGTTWDISYREVESRNPNAARLFQLWGYLDNQDLWRGLLNLSRHNIQAPEWLDSTTANAFDFTKTMKILQGYSLIERMQTSDSYPMHPVVHDWVRHCINYVRDNHMIRNIATCVSCAIPERKRNDYYLLTRRLLDSSLFLTKRLSSILSATSQVDIT
jgi:hypothetical protein